MSTKQLYLVIRLPGGSSTTVPLPISSQLSIRLPLSSSTNVPLPKVVDSKPKSSTGVPGHHHRTGQNLSIYTHCKCSKICKYIVIQNKGGIQTNQQKQNVLIL